MTKKTGRYSKKQVADRLAVPAMLVQRALIGLVDICENPPTRPQAQARLKATAANLRESLKGVEEFYHEVCEDLGEPPSSA